MAFQEPVDPLVEKIQSLIDELKQDINHKEFEGVLDEINEKFPLVDLSEFLEMFVDGEYHKVMIEKFHIVGYADYRRLLSILKLHMRRKSDKRNTDPRKQNLQDSRLSKRYEFLHLVMRRFQKSIKDKITHNILRAIVIIQLFSNERAYTNEKRILQSISRSISDFEHLVLVPHKPLSEMGDWRIREMVRRIIKDLKNRHFLEEDDSGNFRLEPHQLEISEYAFNIIRKNKGITHEDLLLTLQDKLPILSQIPSALVQITLHELLSQNKVIKKEGYWKQRPFFDQYFTFEEYRRTGVQNMDSSRKNKRFFGRRIDPDEFITELIQLEKGDFEDQDDQVTRIAGMVLSNSNMMYHPPNELAEFDFTVDLSSYEFTKEQQRVIKNLDMEIKSNMLHIKVMINERLTIQEVSDMMLKLKAGGRSDQGFVVSFVTPDKLVRQVLQKNKTVQVISESELKEWCKITPIIPSRRGAVAVVRQGDDRGSIVQIKSVNYESGQAGTVLCSTMEEKAHYIGALEEITLPVGIAKFIEHANMYFQFLHKLYLISQEDRMQKIILDGMKVKKTSVPRISSDRYIECMFDGTIITRICLERLSNRTSLKYATDDLFSCSCFQWNHKSRSKGLCDHLIFTLNESIKNLLSSKVHPTRINTRRHLQSIERRMDLFLNRLRYSSTDGSDEARCPNCGHTAHSLHSVEDGFGFRQMKKDDRFSLRRQSRCKKCRRP